MVLLNIGKINEDDDLEEWNLSKASSFMLRAIVQLTSQDIIDTLMTKVVQRNIFLIFCRKFFFNRL